MIPASVLVPLRDNDGNLFNRQLRSELETRLDALSSGWSVETGIRGKWTSPDGTVYRDESDRYHVWLDRWTDLPGFLTLALWVKEAYGQMAVAINIAGFPDII